MSIQKRVLLFLLLVVALSIVTISAWFPTPKQKGYTFVSAWGKRGREPGQFREPIGIAMAGDRVYVSDAGNQRIQVFDQNGRFLQQFGRSGSGLGELNRPMHLDVAGSEIYVAEYLNDRIQIFDLHGKPLRLVGSSGSGPGQFDAPAGVAVDRQQGFYVADFYNHRIQYLKADGTFVYQLGVTGKKGTSSNRFEYPTDVALLPNANLVVADAYNNRIEIFSPAGHLWNKWGGPFAIGIAGSFHGWFHTATGVGIDSKGDIFVADFYNHRIQHFSADGELLSSTGEQGSANGQLRYPTDVAVNSAGFVYVVDFGNDRIQKFGPDVL